MEIEGIRIDDTVDITDKVCPLTFVKAKVAMEINADHPIADKLKAIAEDKAKLADYAKLLYAQARLISGLQIENPAEISELVCELM